VVPTRDTRELTLRCLASFLEADAAGAEAIVVDDGSLDGTTDAVSARFPQVLLLRHAEPRGFTASGEVVLLLNSDTEMEPAALGPLLAAFDARPRLGAAGAALSFFDGRPQWSGGREPTPLWLFALASGLGRLPDRLPGYRRVRPLSAGPPRRGGGVRGAAMARPRGL
jgi:GT2 family glycosyltransferase